MKRAFPLIIFLMANCTQHDRIVRSKTPAMPIFPSPITQPGRVLEPPELAEVRTPPEVTSYQLGRLLSQDRRTMHEAHKIYRMTGSPRWDLDPIPQRSLSASPGPLFHSEELDAELKRQKEFTAELQVAKDELDALSIKTIETLKLIDQQSKLQALKSDSNDDLSAEVPEELVEPLTQ